MSWRTLPSVAATCFGLILAGCSVNAHYEWHAGSGGDPSAGSEEPVHEHHHHHAAREPRHSDAGRDNVVRVTSTDKPVSSSGDSGEGERGEVHPTGPAPEAAKASASDDGSRGGGTVSSSGPGDTSPSSSGGSSDNTGSSDATPAPSEDGSTGGKGTLKRENEPHIARPVKRPRAIGKSENRRDGEGTSKGGRRE